MTVSPVASESHMSQAKITTNFPALHFAQPWVLKTCDGSGDLDRLVTFDEELLNQVSRGDVGPCLCIQRYPQCLVATVRESRMPNFEAARRKLSGQGWPVIVRCSGGSCVPQGPGVVNFSLVHPKIRGWSLENGYQLLCDFLQLFLESYGLAVTSGEVPGSFCDGRYNLQVEGLKIVGTAQRWAGGSRENAAVLSHACLLVDLDLVEATEKINLLYNLCGAPQQFSPATCTTIRDHLNVQERLSTEDFVMGIEQRLKALARDYFNL